MTTNQPSQFAARSDQAALALKARMRDKDGNPLQPRSVPVGENGQPVPPLPPEGSYARQAIERQRQAAAARATPQQPDDLQPEGNEEPNGQPLANPEQPPAPSPNAQRRISELSGTLRQREQALQQAEAKSRALEESLAQTNARLASIESNYKQVIDKNLDALDPDTRAQVLNDARIAEQIAGIENRLLGRIAPVLENVRKQAAHEELVKLSQRYPGFDQDTHLPLIEIFREKNPHCSVEQAFRAIAEPEELMTRTNRAPAVPPIVTPPPSNGSPRYVPPPPDPKARTPEQEVAELRDRAMSLARSDKPEDKRAAGRAMDAYLAQKLNGRLPGQATQRRG